MCSWLRCRRSSVGDDAFRRTGVAPVAVEAGADERFVGQVVPGEHGGDPLEERGFGQRAGRGQQAEDGPFDAIRERGGGRFAVRPIAEPPAAGLDLDQAVLRRSRQLPVDQGDEPFDGVRGFVAQGAGDPCATGAVRGAGSVTRSTVASSNVVARRACLRRSRVHVFRPTGAPAPASARRRSRPAKRSAGACHRDRARRGSREGGARSGRVRPVP